MKTLKDWHSTLEEYLKPGDEIDKELYWYFLEVLPPVYQDRGVFQPDEPYSHNSEGKPTFDTFQKITDRYFYKGHLTTDEAKKLAMICADRACTNKLHQHSWLRGK